jgi:hypothetical protein
VNRHFSKDVQMAKKYMKNVQHDQSSEKWNSKPQWNTGSASYVAVVRVANTSEGVETGELLLTVAGVEIITATMENSIPVP